MITCGNYYNILCLVITNSFSLLSPNPCTQKRWTAPAIVDRALKYIPELEKEVNALRSDKEKIVRSAAKAKNKYITADQSPTVLLNKVNQEEAIIQICVNNTRQDDHNQDDGSSFTNLLQNLENEGICIKTASTLYVCHSRICHNLHIQVIITSIFPFFITGIFS